MQKKLYSTTCLCRSNLTAVKNRMPGNLPVPMGAKHSLHAGALGPGNPFSHQILLEPAKGPQVINTKERILCDFGEWGDDKLVPRLSGKSKAVELQPILGVGLASQQGLEQEDLVLLEREMVAKQSQEITRELTLFGLHQFQK